MWIEKSVPWDHCLASLSKADGQIFLSTPHTHERFLYFLPLSVVQKFPLGTQKYLFSDSSILDQQQKQAIPFQGGVVLSDFDGRIFVASTKEIYSLVPVAWEKQVSFFH